MTAVFAVLWIFEGFLISISYHVQEAMLIDFFFFLVEIPFLLVMSFCYQGKVVRRLLMAVIIPTVYWFGKLSIMSASFETIADESQDVIVTFISVTLFFAFEMIMEKTGKSRQERERELLEQEIHSYENQFGVIRQSQHNIRALKHDMKRHREEPVLVWTSHNPHLAADDLSDFYFHFRICMAVGDGREPTARSAF